MNEPLTQLSESLGKWAKIVQSNTEQRIAKAFFRSILNTSSISTSFSGWLLAISGATIGLVFSNIESVSATLSASGLRMALGFLIASCAAGFVVRIAGTYVELCRQIIVDLESTLESILDEHDQTQEKIEKTAGSFVEPPNLEPDLLRAIGHILECVPPIFRRKALGSFEKGKSDPLFVYKRATRINFVQSVAVFVQVIFFGIFSIVVFILI